jgi:hypothetical protein
MITIIQGTTNRIMLDVSTDITDPYFLIQFTNPYSGKSFTALFENQNSGCSYYLIDIIEVGEDGTADNVNGRIRLSPFGQYELQIYAQMSSTNLDVDNAILLGDDTTAVLPEVIVEIEYDADAQIYFDALVVAGYAITDTEKGYWNTTIIDFKLNGLWDIYLGIYFELGTEAADSINIKNPGTYDKTYYGTWVHSATGALPNGIDAWANTNFNPFGILDFGDVHISFYSGTTDSVNNGVDIGNSALGVNHHIYANFSGQAYFESPPGDMIHAAPLNTGGLFTGSRTSYSNAIFKRNATTLGTNTTDYSGALMPNVEIHISEDAGAYSDRQNRWESFGYGLTSEEIDIHSAIIGTLQSNYGRQIV